MRNISQECLSIKKSGSNYNYQRQGSMSSNSIRGSVVFGNDLVKQVQLENSKVPLIVQHCVEAVEARGSNIKNPKKKKKKKNFFYYSSRHSLSLHMLNLFDVRYIYHRNGSGGDLS